MAKIGDNMRWATRTQIYERNIKINKWMPNILLGLNRIHESDLCVFFFVFFLILEVCVVFVDFGWLLALFLIWLRSKIVKLCMFSVIYVQKASWFLFLLFSISWTFAVYKFMVLKSGSIRPHIINGDKNWYKHTDSAYEKRILLVRAHLLQTGQSTKWKRNLIYSAFR